MSLKNLYRKKYNKTLFTTPSHSQKFFILSKIRQFYKYDISETETHNPDEYLKSAQEKAAKIYGVNQTIFLTNGSTSGVIAGVLACVNRGDNILIWKDSHKSHKNAAELAGANIIFYDVEIDKDWGVPVKVTDTLLEKYFKSNKIKAVIVTSPNYYGIVSDISSVKNLCDRYGAYLIVDEAHGALYPFSDKLPESSVKCADITVQSLHKTAGGLNPTALIHSNLDFDIQPFVDKISTTSPSYPLLYSIEATIDYLNSKRGRNYISNLCSEIVQLRNDCKNIEFFGDDITKILVKKKGLSGFDFSKKIYNDFNIEDEIVNDKSLMFLCGIGTNPKKIKKLSKALSKI